MITQLKKTLTEQTIALGKHIVVLEKITENIFSDCKDFGILPINSIEDLKAVEEKIANLSKDDLVRRARQYSYLTEEHNVETEDGYILKLFRIKSSPIARCKNALPVYVHHGLFESSDMWLVNGPRKALAYVLAESGYDVWLGNARGNTYSRQHKNLSPNSPKFWQFSFHEISVYDNPAVMDYILSTTGQKQLHYIGHSQGATTFFVLMSLIPEYNKKIKTMHALAPVAFFKDHKSQFFELTANHSETLMRLARNYGLTELLPNSVFFQTIAGSLCDVSDTTACYGLSRMIGGQSPKQETVDIFPEILQIFPAGSSVFQLMHFIQGIKTGGFRFYDFGMKKNMKRYGSETPPDYPLRNITASPIFLYISQGDTIVQPTDLAKLVTGLPKKPATVEVEDKQFGHLDFLIGKYAKKMVYNRIIREMKAADGIVCK